MIDKDLKALTAAKIAEILALHDADDDFDPSGVQIAEELLSGKVAFVRKEVCAIAAHLGMSVDELVRIDNRFAH